MAIVVWLFLAYAAGLWMGFGALVAPSAVAVAVAAGFALLRRDARPGLAAATHLLGVLVARDAASTDVACLREAIVSGRLVVRFREPLRSAGSATARATQCGVVVRVGGASSTQPAGAVAVLHGRFQRSGRGLRVRGPRIESVRGPGLTDRLKSNVSSQMDRRFEADAPLARALVLAEQYDLSADLRAEYADAGIIHMVSVSGLHISIIAGGLLAVLASLGLPVRWAQGAAVAVLFAYVGFIGAPAPAVRSAAMLSLSLGSRWIQRNTCPWAVWAVGSAVSLLEPRTAVDLGWQLSVGGMAGLIASGGLFARWFPASEGWRLAIGESVVATGVATIVSAPVVAWTFGRISVAALFTNLLAAPLFNVAQPLLFVTVMLDWLDPLATWLADATRGALALIGLVAWAGAKIPLGVVSVAPSAYTAIGVALTAAAVVVACVSHHWRRPATIAIATVVALLWRPILPTVLGPLEVHVLDVGQGDALAIRSPRGRWLLLDAGGSWRRGDSGASVVWPLVRGRGGDVVYLALSHPHADHVGGARSLIGAAAVDTLLDTGFPGGSPAYREVLDSGVAQGVAWRRALAGDTLGFDGARIVVLAPSAGWLAQQVNPNEASLVLRVEYGAARFLLMGDAEAGEEGWLVEQYPASSLRADVLKVGHHGSSTSSTPALLDRIQPQLALVSVGADNEYGHPSGDVLHRLKERGVRVLRTDHDGTIMVSTDGASFDVQTQTARWHFLPGSSTR